MNIRLFQFLRSPHNIFLGVFLITLLLPMAGIAKVEWPSTLQSIKDAPLIVYGRVIKLEEIDLRSWHLTDKGATAREAEGDTTKRVGVATLLLRDVIKGRYQGSHIKVIAVPIQFGDRIKLFFGHEYVLMIKPYHDFSGKIYPGLYIPTHRGYGSSIANSEPEINKERWSRPLRFYYHRDEKGTWVTKDFPNIEEFIMEIKRTMDGAK